MHSNLTRAMSRLISTQDRTYAEIFMQLQWVPDYNLEWIMEMDLGKDQLKFNPRLLDQCTDYFTFQLLQHEALHLIFDHGPRMMELKAMNERGMIAADLVVNQFVPNFPDSIVLDGEEKYFATLNNFRPKIPHIQADQTFEYYYRLFHEQPDAGEGMSSPDGHEGLGDQKDGTGNADANAAKAKQMVKKAVERARQAGQEPGGVLRQLIADLLETKTDWKRALRNFPQDAEVTSYVAHRFKRNRKYGYAFPGYKPERSVKVAVAIDLSGSIGDDIKDQFCHELQTIANNGCEIEIIFFDDRVTGQEKFTPQTLKKEWGGGGGTKFQPAIDAAAKLDVDGLIFLTDGCNFDTLTKPKFPVLWGILDGFEFNQPFGRHIMLTPEKK